MRGRRIMLLLLLAAWLLLPPPAAEAKLVSDGLGNVYEDGLPDETPGIIEQMPADDAAGSVDEDAEPEAPQGPEAEDVVPPEQLQPEQVVLPGDDAEDEPPQELPELLLSNLIIEGVELEQDFLPHRHRYEAYADTEVTEVWVEAEAEYGSIYINSRRCDERSVPLSGAAKDINIVLQADGEQVTYTITVYRSAPAVERTLYLQIGHSFALLDGEPLQMDAPPELQDGRTMVPLRLVAEALGASVAWVAEERRVDIAYDGQLLQLFVGMAAEGLDVPPYIKNDRTMVPLRYIMETFGADVSWNAADKSITITFVEGE